MSLTTQCKKRDLSLRRSGTNGRGHFGEGRKPDNRDSRDLDQRMRSVRLSLLLDTVLSFEYEQCFVFTCKGG